MRLPEKEGQKKISLVHKINAKYPVAVKKVESAKLPNPDFRPEFQEKKSPPITITMPRAQISSTPHSYFSAPAFFLGITDSSFGLWECSVVVGVTDEFPFEIMIVCPFACRPRFIFLTMSSTLVL